MPLTKKGKKIKAAMQEDYGKKEGEAVFYASKNKGTIKGVDKGGPSGHGGMKRNKHCRRVKGEPQTGFYREVKNPTGV